MPKGRPFMCHSSQANREEFQNDCCREGDFCNLNISIVLPPMPKPKGQDGKLLWLGHFKCRESFYASTDAPLNLQQKARLFASVFRSALINRGGISVLPP